MMSKKTFSRLSAAILLLLTVSIPVGAQEISVEAARQTAAKFINEHAAKLPAKSRKGMMKAPPKAESLQLVYTQEDQLHESPALYVFEQPKQGGFVIASADERAYPILGYNEIGTFREDSLPCCLKFILEEYGKQIAEARTQNLPRHTEKADNESWQNIEPLLTCTWGQGAPFNNLYPILETGRRVHTGCTNTSFVQIMYYWKWPERGVGSKSMNWMKDIPVTVNFGETTYRWDLMKDHYNYQNGYDDPENAVATLFYHFSVATTGNWSYDSAPSDIFGGLSTHFNYSILNEIGGMSPDIIYKELSRGIPLQISGGDIEDPYVVGHEYVCDGYRTDGFFHFNLGWGGSSNGYYKMDAVSGYKSSNACKIVPKIDEITEANGLVYDILYTGEACLSEAKNAEGHIEIPGEITINGKKHPVTDIYGGVFRDNSAITSVTIPNSVISIGWEAFRGCSGLTSVTIGNSVESIGSYAFYKCSGLTSVTFHCKEIGSWFKGNTNIKEIVISDEVTSIGNSAFDGCSGLTSVTISNSVTSIGEYAFADCSGLTSVTIPNSVTSIGEFAFAVCSGLTSIVVESGNSKYDSRENCNAIIETASNTLIAGCMNSIIPNSVSSIGDGAFVGCSGLTSVTIPNSVTNIGNYAFVGCSGLTSISVASGNNKYDSRGNCNAIIETASNTLIQGCKNTIIPNSVTSIGEDAFSYCSGLTSITIPNSVTTIGNWAFASCPGLTSVISCIENPFAIDTSVFEDIPSDATLYVPIGTSDKYKSTFCWNYFKNIVEIEIDGIEGVIVEDSSDCENAPMYNLSGQRVGKNYKGIVIKNGKKVKK